MDVHTVSKMNGTNVAALQKWFLLNKIKCQELHKRDDPLTFVYRHIYHDQWQN